MNNNIEYDLVFITRFDLLFQKNFNESNIQLDKFNLVSKLEHPKLICDNLYIFPFSKLKQFYTIVELYINCSLHKIKKHHNINFKYAILGNGPELSRLKDLVMKYNLINQVDFLESFSSTDEVYNYSKIHVMPTITTPDSIEGFGISNIEAASKGLPCIVSNSGGTPESIQDNGFIISENNVEELIDAILKVMKNLPKLSKKSLNFAKKFRDSSKIQEYLNCI